MRHPFRRMDRVAVGRRIASVGRSALRAWRDVHVVTPSGARLASSSRALGAAALVAGSVAVLAIGAGCSSTPDTKGPNDLKRDLVMHHEDCDTGSASAQKVDVNGDGRPDIIHVMKGGKEVCRVVDLNMDGRNDVFIYYDDGVGAVGDESHERRRESDFDRDGHADEITILKGGVPVEKLRETNFDGKLDTWDTYQNGRLVKRERDTNGDGIIDQWWDFNNPNDPKCAVVSNDTNQDGQPDPQTAVDLCGEAYGAPTAAPVTPAPSASSAAPAASAAPSASAPSPAPSAAPPAPSASTPAPASPAASATPPKGKP